MTISIHNIPRLLSVLPLAVGGQVLLPENQSHYLKNVLRKNEGDALRLFHPESGEFLARISVVEKKSVGVMIESQLRPAEIPSREIHLFFSPIKKDRQDMLIEKAVELGVTHLHPVLFVRSIVREVKTDRILAQIVEACEQCERLDVPVLMPLIDLRKIMVGWPAAAPLYAAFERQEGSPSLGSSLFDSLADLSHVGYLVGPEGGITAEEIESLSKHEAVRPVSLGPRILRAETAVFYGLSLLSAKP